MLRHLNILHYLRCHVRTCASVRCETWFTLCYVSLCHLMSTIQMIPYNKCYGYIKWPCKLHKNITGVFSLLAPIVTITKLTHWTIGTPWLSWCDISLHWYPFDTIDVKSTWYFTCRNPVSRMNILNYSRHQTRHLLYFVLSAVQPLSVLLPIFSLFIWISTWV